MEDRLPAFFFYFLVISIAVHNYIKCTLNIFKLVYIYQMRDKAYMSTQIYQDNYKVGQLKPRPLTWLMVPIYFISIEETFSLIVNTKGVIIIECSYSRRWLLLSCI